METTRALLSDRSSFSLVRPSSRGLLPFLGAALHLPGGSSSEGDEFGFRGGSSSGGVHVAKARLRQPGAELATGSGAGHHHAYRAGAGPHRFRPAGGRPEGGGAQGRRGEREAEGKDMGPSFPFTQPGKAQRARVGVDARLSIWLCIFFFKRPEFISCKANLASPSPPTPFPLLALQLILKLKASLSGTTASLQHKNSQICDVLTVDGECF